MKAAEEEAAIANSAEEEAAIAKAAEEEAAKVNHSAWQSRGQEIIQMSRFQKRLSQL